MVDSRIKGFHKKSIDEKRKEIGRQVGLTDEELENLKKGGINIENADKMVENVVGMFNLPLGIATNFKINNKDYLIPMATEEPSVVAAASNAARIAREKGGFKSISSEQLMIGQIQVIDCDIKKAGKKILDKKNDLMEIANCQDPILVKFGGGVRDIEVRPITTTPDPMLIIHLTADVKDAMGANAINTMCESLKCPIEEITGGQVILRILSNHAVKRTVRSEAVFSKELVGGKDIVARIIKAYEFADNDIYRAVTHNKGVMNGISAVVRATGNDTRAVEAGCHAYAVRDGSYKSLTKYWITDEGDLAGSIEVPLAIGIIGGATKTHPTAQTSLKILGIEKASELAEVIASVGLAQNFAAIRALSDEGIQKGHMKLHARNIAICAGASEENAEKVAEEMVKTGQVRVDKAKEIIEKLGK